MKKLIRQIRSLGSLRKGNGVHVPNNSGKPEVSFRTPTYLIKGGSDYSFARQGGFILHCSGIKQGRLVRKAGQAFIAEIMFLRKNINKGFDYWLSSLSRIIKYAGKTHVRHIFPITP